jgi:hypothetical protein
MKRNLCLSAARSAFLSGALLVGACSVSASPGAPGGLPGSVEPGGSCPCTVGNSGIHVTLGCGEAQCLTLNGTETGYRCGAGGATIDPTVCTPGFDAGGGTPDAFPTCTPKSCAEQGFTCGTVPDGCGGMVVCPACTGTEYCSEANQCLARAQNIAIYGDLQGGTFGIEVDKDIPDLAIGLVSNSIMNVTVSGAYAANVVAVYMAVNEGMGSVTGVSPSLVVWHRVPQATVDAGFSDQVIDCETPPSQPSFPCNPPAQVDAFFAKTLGGALLFNDCQAAPFTGTMLISAGGSCM